MQRLETDKVRLTILRGDRGGGSAGSAAAQAAAGGGGVKKEEELELKPPLSATTRGGRVVESWTPPSPTNPVAVERTEQRIKKEPSDAMEQGIEQQWGPSPPSVAVKMEVESEETEEEEEQEEEQVPPTQQRQSKRGLACAWPPAPPRPVPQPTLTEVVRASRLDHCGGGEAVALAPAAPGYNPCPYNPWGYSVTQADHHILVVAEHSVGDHCSPWRDFSHVVRARRWGWGGAAPSVPCYVASPTMVILLHDEEALHKKRKQAFKYLVPLTFFVGCPLFSAY